MTYQFRLQGEPFEFYPEFDDAEDSLITDSAETWEGEVPPKCTGDRYVCWVQESLNKILGLRLKVDGNAGRDTRSAIRSFQSKKGLKPRPDGVICPDTEQALIAAGATPLGLMEARGHETPPGRTFYVDIPLQIPLGKAKSMTGIFVPEDYCPQLQVDLIVYLHGHKLRSHQPHFSIDTYWHLPEFLLREEVNKSKKNVILVAPTLGPKNEPGSLTCPGGFDKFLEQVMMALRQPGRPYAGKTPVIGNIILACHSGSGAVMRAITMGTDTNATKILECWAFEPFNIGDHVGWANWAQSNRKLYIYFLPGNPGQQLSRNLLAVRNLLKPNIVAERSAVKHDDVPRTHLKDRIQGAQFLVNKSNCLINRTRKGPSAKRPIFRETPFNFSKKYTEPVEFRDPIPASEFDFEFERSQARIVDADERKRKALAKRLQNTPVGRALTKMGSKITIAKAPPLYPAHWVRGQSGFEVHCGRQRKVNVVFGLFDQQKKMLAWYLFSSTIDSRSKFACKRSGSRPVVKPFGVASAVATMTPNLWKSPIDVSELVRDAKSPFATMTLKTSNTRITCSLDSLNTKSNGLVHLAFGLQKVSEPSRANVAIRGRLFLLEVGAFDEEKFKEAPFLDPRRLFGPQAVAERKAISNF
jgi:hypothetical protein